MALPPHRDAGAHDPVLVGRRRAAAGRAAVRERLEAGMFAEAERYRHLMAVLNGREPKPSYADDFAWLLEALRAHP